tara:strand:- start:311 stop:646 length:336 start_codon:yes stop_codon:yes gene_type:complete
MRQEFLLRCVNGEIFMMEHLLILTEKNIFTKKSQWCMSSPDFDINPFGKLLKVAGTHLSNGKINTHAKYYHGYHMTIKCTKEFYEKHKQEMDEFIIVDKHILRDSQPPTWL